MSTILDQYVRTMNTVSVGGTGSTTPFTMQSQQQNPPSPVKSLTVYTSMGMKSGSYIQYIKATFFDGSSAAAGTEAGTPVTFNFSPDEALESCYLYFIPQSNGRVAMSFVTSIGRHFVAGDTTGTGVQAALAGGRLFGFFGLDGADVDLLGLTVEIPVVDIQIYDLVYTTTDVSPSALGTATLDIVTLSNESAEPQTASVTHSSTVTSVSSWSFTEGLKIGAKATIEVGIPLVVDGKVEFSAEISIAYTYGESYSHAHAFQYTAQVTVPPNSQVMAEVTATQGSVTLAYTATIQITYIDGVTQSFEASGTYTGDSTYNVAVTYTSPTTGAAMVGKRQAELEASRAAGVRLRTR